MEHVCMTMHHPRRNDYPDSLDDQFSIRKGVQYAIKNKYRYKTKPSWIDKIFGF